MNLPTMIHVIQFKYISLFRSQFGEIDTRVKEFGLDIKWALDLNVNQMREKSIKLA